MSGIRWLKPSDGPAALPDPRHALAEPNGLLAAGGRLSPEWLMASYARGIFPWYEEGQPILWWCPEPRAVLLPERLRVSRSLRKTIAREAFRMTADTAFDQVVAGCAAPREYTDQTWITRDMAAAYATLHALGRAHSFEAWNGASLAGGLYGVAIGRVFFGESMFSVERDASKAAFVLAVGFLAALGVRLIDCQVPSAHLTRLGATMKPRDEFLRTLEELCDPPGPPGPWTDEFHAYLRGRKGPA
jgi:leucyl/phenylalanyl-tRNA--protein transferase